MIDRAEMQDLVSQLVSKLHVMKADGITETSLTLKNMGMFTNATVTIKEYDTAKGEFNISFANLSNEAKDLLDRQQNQIVLKQSLVDKGYTFHILTTTTNQENVALAAEQEEGFQEDKQQDQEGRQKGRQKGRNKKNQDEEEA
jgi:flagellar biosynthesis/type III secretory pathway protein FliH